MPPRMTPMNLAGCPRLSVRCAATSQQMTSTAANGAAAQFIRPHLLKLAPYTPIVPFEVLSAKLGRKPQDIVKLDANENPYGPPPEVLEALGSMDFPNIYPDPESRRLREALAKWHNVPMEHLLVSKQRGVEERCRRQHAEWQRTRGAVQRCNAGAHSSRVCGAVQLPPTAPPCASLNILPPLQVGCGADELIDLLMRCVLDPNDKIVDCPPTFTMYVFDAAVNAAQVVTVPRLDGFRIDVEGAQLGGQLQGSGPLWPRAVRVEVAGGAVGWRPACP